MNINGDIILDHDMGSDYADPGAECVARNGTAWPADADISSVNTDKPGKYPVTYRCSDNGFTLVGHRTVSVEAPRQ